MVKERQRGEWVKFVVVGHASYGVILRTTDDEPGWVEGEHVREGSVDADTWPPIGSKQIGWVLGYANTPYRRLRLCMREGGDSFPM